MDIYVFTSCKEQLIKGLSIVVAIRKYRVRQADFVMGKILQTGLIPEINME